MREWFARQWADIKGNVKYAVVLLILSGVGTVVVAVTRGLYWWQQTILVLCFILLFGCVVTVIVTYREKEKRREAAENEARRTANSKRSPHLIVGSVNLRAVSTGLNAQLKVY